MKILKDMGVKTVILFWDPEERRDMARAVEALKMQFDEVYVPRFDEWPDGKDPGDMLADTDGEVCLENALVDPIDVQSLEYVAWQVG
jgi:hypothetical protein